MNYFCAIRQRQEGSVLLVGMVMLLILLLGAVSMMNSSVMDERMSGNSRRGVDAFMAAEGGMSRALYELDEGRWFTFSCDAETGYTQAAGTFIGGNGGASFGNNGATYRVEFIGDCTEDNGVIEGVRLRSTGEQAGATRVIEFMAGHSNPSWPALFINDNGNCDFESGTSNKFLFDGNGGAAVGANTPQCRQNIEDEIYDVDRRDNYDGAIINYNPAPDFTSAAGLQAFYEAAVAAEAAGATGINVLNASGYKSKGKQNTLDKKDLENLLSVEGRNMGTTAALPSNDANYDPSVHVPQMKTTIVQGNLDITGSITGAGILLVTGEVYFGGTPDWDGIIIVLGGNATIGGGGTSSTGFEGTVIVSDIYYGGDVTNPTTSNWVPGSETIASEMVEWDVSGGGGGNYRYYCNYVQSARQQLKDQLLTNMTEAQAEAVLIPDPGCDGGGEGTLGKAYVVEWYEKVES